MVALGIAFLEIFGYWESADVGNPGSEAWTTDTRRAFHFQRHRSESMESFKHSTEATKPKTEKPTAPTKAEGLCSLGLFVDTWASDGALARDEQVPPGTWSAGTAIQEATVQNQATWSYIRGWYSYCMHVTKLTTLRCFGTNMWEPGKSWYHAGEQTLSFPPSGFACLRKNTWKSFHRSSIGRNMVWGAVWCWTMAQLQSLSKRVSCAAQLAWIDMWLERGQGLLEIWPALTTCDILWPLTYVDACWCGQLDIFFYQ